MTEQERISSDRITREYLDRILVEVRHLDAVMPDVSMELYGKKFATPVMTAALSHLYNTRENGMQLMAEGAKMAGAVCFSGMGSMEETAGMIATGAEVIKIIKPYKDRESIYKKIEDARNRGALAVGIDIDHAFSHGLKYDCIEGMEMRPMTTAELKELVKYAGLPFVIKGVLSFQDAEKCAEAGVRGMVISHHNGRLDCAVPPLMMLPEIRRHVGKDMPLFVDCAIRTGLDVYKALALGADACCVGRPLMPRLKENGAEGVRDCIREITEDLRYAMAMNAAADLKSIDPTSVHPNYFNI